MPSRVTRVWLTLGYRLARPLAGVSPDVVTISALAWTGAAVALADPGTRWPLLAFAAVLVAALSDVVDGALAVATGRARPLGAVLDAMVDRVVDVLLLVALARLGTPVALCVAAGVLLFLLEYLRARAQAAGMDGPGVVTPAERPARVAIALGVLLTAGLRPEHAAVAAQAGVAVQVALGVPALVQLALAVRRQLPAPPPASARR